MNLLMFACDSLYQAACRPNMVCGSGLQFMKYSLLFKSREDIKFVQLLRIHHTTCSLAVSCWNTVLCTRNKFRPTGSITCNIADCYQTVTNVYQRCPMIKHYPTPNHNAG